MLSAAKDGKILAIYFAQPKRKWEKMIEEDKIKFKRIAGKKSFELILASDNLNAFEKQLAKVRSVFIRGGKTDLLKSKLRKIEKDLSRLFSGKTVAGSSAGAYLFSKYHYLNDSNRIGTGFGILPIKVYAHYKGDKKNLDKLKKHAERLKIYAVPETEFVILRFRQH